VEVCAEMTDPTGPSPHVFKNLFSEQRPQIKTFTIPNAVDGITNYNTSIGFEFQIRLVWTGQLRIQKVILSAIPIDDSPLADRDLLTASCIQNDVTGNDVVYAIAFGSACPPPSLLLDTTGINTMVTAVNNGSNPGAPNFPHYEDNTGADLESALTLLGVALWQFNGGSSRSLLKFWAATGFTVGAVLDWTTYGGVSGGSFLFVVVCLGQNGVTDIEIPSNCVIESQSGGVTLSTFNGLAAVSPYIQIEHWVQLPSRTHLGDMNNYGGVVLPSGPVSLKVSLAQLIPIPCAQS
jgi:hypothetical protein